MIHILIALRINAKSHLFYSVGFCSLIITKRTNILSIAAKKHQIEIKYFVVNSKVMTQDNKINVPTKCILLTLETKVETTVGIK